MKEQVRTELKRTFNPEFLNRVDEVVIFHPLTMDHMLKIVDLLIADLNNQLRERELTIEIDDEVRRWIAEKGYDPAYGARPLKKVIRRYFEDPLSAEVLRGRFKEGGRIAVRVEGDQLIFSEKTDLISSGFPA